jgi:hypothetical protein
MSSRDVEEQLRRTLHRRADDVQFSRSWDDIERRTRRADTRRRRAISMFVAAMIVAGPFVGFAIGRVGDESAPEVVARRRVAPAGPPASAAALNGLVPRFRREANGVAIRAFTGRYEASPECPGRVVIAQLSNEHAVSVASAPATRTSDEKPSTAATRSFFGSVEGGPAEDVIVVLDAGLMARASNVRAEFLNGDVDEMEPHTLEDGVGIAVLGHEAASGVAGVGRVTVSDSAGAPIDTVHVRDEAPCTGAAGPSTPAEAPPPSAR